MKKLWTFYRERNSCDLHFPACLNDHFIVQKLKSSASQELSEVTLHYLENIAAKNQEEKKSIAQHRREGSTF